MSDSFGVDAHTRATTRQVKTVAWKRFSPSWGVHRGLIPDPNWPPAHFPDNSVAMQRKDRRVGCRFTLELDGQRLEVAGDVSKGGAMFIVPAKGQSATAWVEVRGVRAELTILSVSERGGGQAHHGRFLDPEAGAAVWKALVSA